MFKVLLQKNDRVTKKFEFKDYNLAMDCVDKLEQKYYQDSFSVVLKEKTEKVGHELISHVDINQSAIGMPW